MNKPIWTPGKGTLVLLSTGLLAFLAISFTNPNYTLQLFVYTTYYFLMITVLCWAGTYLYAARALGREQVIAWVKENWPGLAIAFLVTLVAALAVHPALRILSDEANLVGTSKNFFATKTATFTVSGKNYYDSYWDIDVAIDQRPPLFPFLISLVHAVCGYSYKNVFFFNLMVLPAFVLVTYRLAKLLGGETFGVVASLLVVAHPIALITVRSGSFDFFAAFFALLVIKSLFDYIRESSPEALAILWMNLCMFAEIRYESGLFIPVVVALLLLLRMVTWRVLSRYAFVYALTPVYLLPRIWQSVLRGNVPHQEPGTVTFSAENFFSNAREYFEPILSPFHPYLAHSALVIALGVVGCVLWLRWTGARLLLHDWRNPHVRFAIFVIAWIFLQAIIVFAYVWGRAQYPSAARLVITIDTFFSFSAAWVLTRSLKRLSPFVPVLLGTAIVAIYLPVASQHRILNRLTQTREAATLWHFFENLHEKRILIVTDQPNLFTIMDYGAMDFEAARHDSHLLKALARRLFYEVYLVQQIRLSTNRPLPGFDIWPDRSRETVLEFQNDADLLIRVSRLVH